MSAIRALLRKDFLNFFRNKAAVSLTFAVPFVMIWLFGWIFGVNRKDSGPAGIPVAVVDASGNPAAAALVEECATRGETPALRARARLLRKQLAKLARAARA